MRIVTGLLVGLTAVAGLLHASTPARANVTYDFITTSAQGTLVQFDGFPNDGTGFTGFPLTLTFTNAGVTSGEVSGTETAVFASPTQVSGLAGFVSLATYMDGATLGALYDSLSLDVTFSPQGAITGETINFSGTDLDFSLVNGVAAVGSDGVLNCAALIDSGACTSTGRFVAEVAVPEPATLALVMTGLFGIVTLRRRIR